MKDKNGIGVLCENEMKERPILFSVPMVRAILDGKKTMTRRIYKPHFNSWQVGDRLWVRETFCVWFPERTEGMKDWDLDNPQIAYRADDNPEIESAIQYGAEQYRDFGDDDYLRAWEPSIFMPRKYSRILLEITELKKERIKDCSNEDAVREGFIRNIEFWEYFWEMNSKLYPQGVDEMLLMVNPEVLVIGFKVLEVKK